MHERSRGPLAAKGLAKGLPPNQRHAGIIGDARDTVGRPQKAGVTARSKGGEPSASRGGPAAGNRLDQRVARLRQLS
jgi:hypothetical protein